jgi:LacI family transcriptional regulator/LacI family purine nucleotide synthesis repressor
MAVTIYDVAKESGVSKSTVSLVINNSSAIKLETREKVFTAINKLGYEPNQSARTLMTRRTNILGIIIIVEDLASRTYEFDRGTEVFSYDIIDGMPQGLQGTGYGLSIERFCISEQKGKAPSLLKGNRVDGLLVLGSLFDKEFAERLRQSGLPVIVVGRYHEMFDSVTADIEQGVFIAANHLLHTGHHHLCYINCPLAFSTNLDRKNGFIRALNRQKSSQSVQSWLVDAEHNTGKGGYDAFKKIFESGKRPDGILAANDSIALGIMRYLYEKNIKIPDDVSIISYENSVLSGYASPALSTIDIEKERMGREACEIMLNRLERPRMRKVSLKLPARLIMRDSVKDRRTKGHSENFM